jgi:hypothetical protein
MSQPRRLLTRRFPLREMSARKPSHFGPRRSRNGVRSPFVRLGNAGLAMTGAREPAHRLRQTNGQGGPSGTAAGRPSSAVMYTAPGLRGLHICGRGGRMRLPGAVPDAVPARQLASSQ